MPQNKWQNLRGIYYTNKIAAYLKYIAIDQESK